MITIQGFAKLCGCNAQTLRFYDRIGLLTPAKVDSWTGYRYYEEEQAIRFVKIKNLQRADFSIEEIKTLLEAGDDSLMQAFERKIAEQRKKLEQIREIQQSYLRETMDMQKMVQQLACFVEGQTDDPVLWEELGLDAAQETEISARVHGQMADWLTQIKSSADEIAQQMDEKDRAVMKEVMNALLSGDPEQRKKGLIFAMAQMDHKPAEQVPPEAEKVFVRDDWEHVREWIEDLPALDGSRQSFFTFQVREDSPVLGTGFPSLMLAAMAVKTDAIKGGMTCNIAQSDDGRNHFALYQK